MDENLNLKENIDINEALQEFQDKSDEKKEKDSFEQKEIEEDLSFGKNIKIEDSLKEFQTKYVAEQQQKKEVKKKEEPRSSKMVQLVIKLSGGLITEDKQAEYVLLGITILFFLASGYLFFIGLGGNRPTKMNESPLDLLMQNQPSQIK